MVCYEKLYLEIVCNSLIYSYIYYLSEKNIQIDIFLHLLFKWKKYSDLTDTGNQIDVVLMYWCVYLILYVHHFVIIGNWEGVIKFKLWFNHGGAIEFGQAMLRAGQLGMYR